MPDSEAGERLFSRYAHAPNSLGYCGPAAAAALQRAACGQAVDSEEVRRIARTFSGAWPYQQLIGELSGLDPLGVEVGRAYWTGSALTEGIDNTRFGELLLERFGSQAGHYWTHLTPDLLREATPTHIFHVLGIYPWTRLLPAGPVEAATALSVLDNCRIRVGRVLAVEGTRLRVESDHLEWEGQTLSVVSTPPEEVDFTVDGAAFTDRVPLVGDAVALHWGFACDLLGEEDAVALQRITARQVEATNLRFTR